MALASKITALRCCLAVLVAFGFMLPPMADAQHLETEPAVFCEIDHDSSDVGERDLDHSEREHHAHNCGPCHIHLLRRDMTSDFSAASGPATIRPPLSEDMVSLPPGSLYRPPRA